MPKVKPVKPFYVRVICPEWVAQVETKLTTDLLNAKQGLGQCFVLTLVFDPKEVQLSPAFKNVLPLLGVQSEQRPVDPDKEREMPTLVYYTKRQDKPPSLCSRDNLFYRYVGTEPGNSGKFSTFKPAEHIFPDRSRPLPPNKSLTTLPAPQALNYHSVLPQWLQNGPLLG
jgi:hypothetical protein